ncbi:MAG TPA: PA14 domain-containing protein [Pirellulales bacterium]|nr:PA14 domain-containing protein [Pirellulales bacterium]
MAEDFDPYRKWLGIPPDEQPPDHYRLLGVGRLEDDPDTISNAADRQMAHVRTFQAGPHSAVSQKLLNEISAARVCLLDRAKKAEYDARLRAKQALAAPPPVAVPVATSRPLPEVPGPAPAALFSPTKLGRRPQKKKSPIVPLVAACVLLLTIGAVAFVSRQRRPPQDDQPLAGQVYPTPSTESPQSSRVVPHHETEANSEQPQPPPVSPQAAAKPKLEIVKAEWGAGDRWQDVTDRLKPLVFGEQLVATIGGNLFQGVPDPASGAAKIVRIRYRAAGEERTADFSNNDVIYLDGRAPAARKPSSQGLEVLDARYGAGTTWIDVLPRVRRWIHGGRLAVQVDRVAQTDPLHGQRKAIVLRYRTVEGEFVTHAWDGEDLIIDARPISTSGKATDLLAAADPKRDSAGDPWRKEGAALVGPKNTAGNLTIRTPFSRDYLLTAVVEGPPQPHDIGITLPIGERQVQLAIDGWASEKSALQLVDGAMGQENASTRQGTFCEPGRSTIIHCAVREPSIYVTCNGRVAVDWRGDFSRLSLPGGGPTPGKPAIVLGNLGSPWRYTRLEVAPLAPEPSPSRTGEGKVVDLLKHIDPKLDAVSGEWEKTDEGLLTPVGEFMRLGVPYLPPDDYELRAVVERKSGGDALFLGLIVDGRPTYAVIDGWAGTRRGLSGLDGEGYDRNCTTRTTRVFVDERPKKFICTVHPSSVQITCEGQTLVDWHGDARRFTSKCDVPDELGLQVGDWNTQFLISKFELRSIPPAAPEPPIDLAQPIDLLKRIDPQRDAVWGDWKKEGDVLLAPGDEYARLQLPVLPPEEYILTMDVVGKRDVDFGIVVGGERMEGVIVGGRQVEVDLDGGDGTTSGLQLVDGKRMHENSSAHHGKVLREDKANEIVCTVRREHVVVECNGQPVIDWRGDSRSLGLLHDRMMPDDRRLFLGNWSTPYRITRLELSAPGAETARPKTASSAGKPPSADKRAPIPAEKSLASAGKKVADRFDREWKAAKKFPERMAVARRIYDAGLQTTDDPVLRYALLREASRRAAVLGDASTACDAIEKLGQEFQIDTLAEKLALISEALTKAHLGSQNWNLAIQSLLLCDRAVALDRFEEARKFASLAAAAGRRTRSHDLAAYADARLARVRSRQEEYERFELAIARLKEQPDDAEANRTAGIDFCLFQGDWQRGLPLLARSGEERLVEIAKLEPVAGADAAQRTPLVDAWLGEAEKHSGELRSESQLQAKYWYDRGLAAEALADADRKAALAKLATLPGISQARVKPGLDMAMFDGGDFQQFRVRRVEGQICHHFGLGSPDPAVPGDYFSIRWTGWIKPPLPGKYLVKTTSDDSIRVRINGKLVIDHWNRGAGDEQAEVTLSDQLQPLIVEYNDYTEGADVCLSWSLKNFSDFQVVPPEALFHDPAVVP